MIIRDVENNVLEIENQGKVLRFQKDNIVINLGFEFYIVVKPINYIEDYDYGEDTAIVMKYDPLGNKTIGTVTDRETAYEVMNRWGEANDSIY